MKVKLAEALLRRKELNGRVDRLSKIKDSELAQLVVRRQPVTENVDQIQATVPKLKPEEVMAEYDFAARQLRLVDAAIQQANWTTEIEVDSIVMEEYLTSVANEEKKED